MKVKYIHILIFIILIIGSYLLTNRCICNGFSVGAAVGDLCTHNDPNYELEPPHGMDPEKIKRIWEQGSCDHNEYCSIYDECKLNEPEQERQRVIEIEREKVEAALQDIVDAFIDDSGPNADGEEYGIDPEVKLHLIEKLFDDDFCKSYKEYNRFSTVNSTVNDGIENFEERFKTLILAKYPYLNDIEYEELSVKEMFLKYCMPKIYKDINIKWDDWFMWYKRDIKLYSNRLVIRDNDTEESIIPLYDIEIILVSYADMFYGERDDYPTNMSIMTPRTDTISTILNQRNRKGQWVEEYVEYFNIRQISTGKVLKISVRGTTTLEKLVPITELYNELITIGLKSRGTHNTATERPRLQVPFALQMSDNDLELIRQHRAAAEAAGAEPDFFGPS